MNKAYDYNGVQVSTSKPIQKLRTVKKTLHIDSADRDTGFYQNSGDFVLYLPRVYEKVVSITVKQAEFPAASLLNSFDKGTSSGGVTLASIPSYFFVEIDGLNKSDEGAVSADRSSFVDSVFAKFQITSSTDKLFYTESSGAKITEYYQPSISKLDRLKIRVRMHNQTKNQNIYWNGSNFSMTLELETLENSFDDFSSIETRIGDRN